jgi:GDPmannose 4,6-dehydratase
MYLILQQEQPDDYVIATGIATDVREFVNRSFAVIGITLSFKGEKENETGSVIHIEDESFIKNVGKGYLPGFKSRIRVNPIVVKVDPAYFRPTEVDLLIGDPSKAKSRLGWIPEYDLDGLINEMVTSDLVLMKRENYLREGGYKILNYFE